MDRDPGEQWTAGWLRAVLEELAADTPLSVCLPSADGTLVCAPLVSVGYGAEVDDALPGLEYPLIGTRDDPRLRPRWT